MIRRILPTLLVFGVGFLALMTGLFGLNRIFYTEREQARAKSCAHRNALEQYSRQALKEKLNAHMKRAERDIKKALSDPLFSDKGLFLREQKEIRLPRPVRYLAGEATPAKDLYDALEKTSGRLLCEDPDSPWTQRLELMASFVQALTTKDKSGMIVLFREILNHRAGFVIASVKDIPYMVFLLEIFTRMSSPASSTMRGLLRDGLSYGKNRRMLGMQRLVLTKRRKLTQPDFKHLSQKIIQLSQFHRVRYEDFKEAALGLPPSTIEVPEDLGVPGLTSKGEVFVLPEKNQRVMGVSVQLDRLLSEIAREMKDRHLLSSQDFVAVISDMKGFTPLDDLSISIYSASWSRDLRRIDGRYRLKTGLGVLCGVLALVIVILAAFLQLRKQRFLKLKSDFLATVSHELRTPLASIQLLSETLELRTRNHPDLAEFPTRILRDVDSLSFLVENILSFNRLDKGRLTPRFAAVRLEDLLSSLEKELSNLCRSTLVLTAEGAEGIVFPADAELLKILFSNLGRNACLYNNRDPVKIDISARLVGSKILVSFSDNGIGISDEEREKIFDEFYRSKDRTGKAVRGSGLGLAMCRRIMKMHHGSIKVTASGPGGTTFELAFYCGEK